MFAFMISPLLPAQRPFNPVILWLYHVIWSGIIVTVSKTPTYGGLLSLIRHQSQKLNFKSAEFLQSASALSNAPADFGCEVALLGSNAVSMINALTGRFKLARTSRTPDTQLINFLGSRSSS